MADDDKTLVERLRTPMNVTLRDGALELDEYDREREAAADRIEALEAEADAWNRKAVAAMEERNAALAQVAAAFEAAAQVLDTHGDSAATEGLGLQLCCSGHMCGCRGSTVGEFLQHLIRAATPTDARAAYDDALRKARAEGMREAAEMANGKTVQEHYVEWPWWGRGNRSKESELAVFSKHLSGAILARTDREGRGPWLTATARSPW